ncbi:MAG: arginase family protein, partial [Nitrospinae bacterium]|nr:arginase family protein [Nitrospinota bacterium]
YKDLSVLQFDAHPDLYDEWEESYYSHACTMRRISEISPFVQVGIRCISSEEAEFIEENKIKVIMAKDYLEKRCDIKEVLTALSDHVYITVDLDVLDPSIMPSVGTPEPGGLLWYDLLSILKMVIKDKTIVGFDVVELCPIPGNTAPDFLAAKLVYKMISYIFDK